MMSHQQQFALAARIENKTHSFEWVLKLIIVSAQDIYVLVDDLYSLLQFFFCIRVEDWIHEWFKRYVSGFYLQIITKIYQGCIC